MPQLLLEFFSEEIPARMQARAEADLERLLMDKLAAAGFLPEAVKAFAGPRRLAAVVEGLPLQQPDVAEEKKGPRVGAPEAAVQGFLKSAGLASLEEAQIVEDKKGAFYLANIHKPGRKTPELLAEILPEIAKSFPWPKSMRWGEGEFYWVRPLQGILCAFEGEPVAFEVGGVAAGVTTCGHRFHAPAPFPARDFEAYRDGLARARVLLTREERKARILAEAKTLCAAQELELVEDAGLLEELAGLSEWPVPLLGAMDPAFLELPEEVIRLTMRTHQRYFAVREANTGRLAPHFIAVANIEAKDGGAAIAAGNARVLSARLADARFFWEADQARPLASLLPRLDRIVFHEKLGSVGEKARRVEALAVELAEAICPEEVELVRAAAHLAKADLVSDTVGEFPELQGQAGGWLYRQQSSPVYGGGPEAPAEGEGAPPPPLGPAGHSPRARGEMERIAAAIEDHYRPQGPSDRVPTDPAAICVALADKLDTLVGFWAIDERPTGSKDPYALRRAALGFVRIVLENGVRVGNPGLAESSAPSPRRGEGRGGGAAEMQQALRSGDHPGVPPTPAPPPVGEGSENWLEELLVLWFYENIELLDPQEDRSLVLRLNQRIEPVPRFRQERLLFDFDGLWSEVSALLPKRDWENENREPLLSAEERGRVDAGLERLRLRADEIDELQRFGERADRLLEQEFGPGGVSPRYRQRLRALRDSGLVREVARRLADDLLAFLAERLKVQLREQGRRHDLVDAVFALGDDDLVRIVSRVEALDAFLQTGDGANLLAGYRRAANILKAEEKKDPAIAAAIAAEAAPQPAQLTLAPEQALLEAIEAVGPAAAAAVAGERFGEAMAALARLRGPVDAFFESVLVNDKDPAVRKNRLLLLAQVRRVLHQAADFGRIEG